MAKKSIFEVESDEDIEQWHDEAYAEYEKALNAYSEDIAKRRKSGDPDGFDKKLRNKYEETRDTLQAGVTYWRQVGEASGRRTGVEVVDNVIEPEEDSE